MCGLVGVAGDVGPKAKKSFEYLLMVDVIRGEHSTGVCVRSKGKAKIFKALGKPWDRLFSMKRYQTAVNSIDVDLLLGHNRAATVGKVVPENAHPFRCEHVYGAHNGTLRNSHKLKDRLKFDVDSEGLFHHIAHEGLQDALSNCAGAYALTWYDDQDKTINFIRNTERSLFYAFSPDHTELYWASEEWMLKKSFKFAKYYQQPTIHTFEPMLHYKITIPNKNAKLFLDKKFGKFRVKKLVAGTESVRQQMWQGNSYYRQGGGRDFNGLVNRQGNSDPKTLMLPTYKRQVACIPEEKKIISPVGGTIKRLSDYVGGQLIAFTLTDNLVDRSNQEYHKGHIVNNPDIEVRVYRPSSNYAKKFREIAPLPGRGSHMFIGKISKKLGGHIKIKTVSIEQRFGEKYLSWGVKKDGTLRAPMVKSNDKPSVESYKFLPAPEEQQDPGVIAYAVGVDRRLVDPQEAKRLLQAGCGMCASPLFLKDITADKLDWVMSGTDEIPVCCMNAQIAEDMLYQ